MKKTAVSNLKMEKIRWTPFPKETRLVPNLFISLVLCVYLILYEGAIFSCHILTDLRLWFFSYLKLQPPLDGTVCQISLRRLPRLATLWFTLFILTMRVSNWVVVL